MKIAIPRERRRDEHRVAASPDTIKKLVGLGFEVVVEAGAGAAAFMSDAAFADAGALVAEEPAAAVGGADLVLRVRAPLIAAEGADEVVFMKRGALLIGLLEPGERPDHTAEYVRHGLTAFALELLPRISRAQSMDALSSQANLAGYRAVIEAAAESNRAFPMMMTAAGTIAPARVLVLGAGVAGLQAIATARRLGGVVSAFDVRAAAKEEVESLGARFVSVAPDQALDRSAVYATEMGEDYRRRQADVVRDTLKSHDIAICSALIPGRRAPVLITADMVAGMRPGSVIVDLAAASGGNCELSRPGEVADVGGVRILAPLNMPSRIAADASHLYARNLLAFVRLLAGNATGGLAIDWADEIVRATLVTRESPPTSPSLGR